MPDAAPSSSVVHSICIYLLLPQKYNFAHLFYENTDGRTSPFVCLDAVGNTVDYMPVIVRKAFEHWIEQSDQIALICCPITLDCCANFRQKCLCICFDGLINSLPLYFRMFCPKKSKPSVMWVILIFPARDVAPVALLCVIIANLFWNAARHDGREPSINTKKMREPYTW